ncbi:hypothetical protein BC629DRAFT_353443 [Irpex lacteus]|nr:hypothetical protein BC629DRAFT_353443 [Irpex lacteus]
MQQLQSFSLIIQNSAFALFTALRTCALYDRNKCIFLAVFLPAIARTLFDTVVILSHASLADAESTLDACSINMSLSMVAYEGFSWSTYILLIASDALALVLTWRKAIGVSKDASKIGAGVSLSKVLVRDGSFLFVGLLMCNILNIAIDNLSCGFMFTGGSTIPATLSAIMTCRFISNLKQAADGPNGDSTVRIMSLVQFNADRLFGNLGEPLDLTDEHSDSEDLGTQSVAEENDVEQLPYMSYPIHLQSSESFISERWCRHSGGAAC